MDHAGEEVLVSGWERTPGGYVDHVETAHVDAATPAAAAVAAIAGTAWASNGIQASMLPGASWHKSSYSGPNGDCVEAAEVPVGVAVRNSRFPDGPALLFTESEWDAFLRGVKGGDFG